MAMPKPPPSVAAIPPHVVDSALAVTSSGGFDHVRQRGGQRREEEPVNRHDNERGDVEQFVVDARRHLGGDAQNQHSADQVREHKHPLAPPAVEQHAGERPDEAVRQQDHRESSRDLGRVRLPLRVEQHRAGQRYLEDTVAELAEQTHEQQPPEVAPSERDAQVTAMCTARR